MASVNMTQKLSASADQVWGRIGDFGKLHEIHPAIEKTEMEGGGVGSVRNLFLAGGGNVLERLDEDDSAGRSYTYTILESPLPVANYQATIRAADNGDGTCTVHWSSKFDADGAPDTEVEGIIQGIFQAGFDTWKSEFGG